VSRLYPRLSRDGRHWAAGHDTIVIDGRDTGLPGTRPVWLEDGLLLYTRQGDGSLGSVMSYRVGDAAPVIRHEFGGNPPIAAAGGRYAYQRFDPPRVVDGVGIVASGFVSPQFSDDGLTQSMLRQSDQSLWVGIEHQVDPAHILWHAWSRAGATLVFQRENGTMAGLVDWTNPAARGVVELGYGLKPVAIWTGLELWVLYHDVDRILLAEWGSLSRGEPRGYVLRGPGFDGGPAYSHDARALAVRTIRVLAHDVAGDPIDIQQDLQAPRVALTRVVVPSADRYAFASDGTPVDNAFPLFFGQHPSQAGADIYLPKNTPPEGEWRRVLQNGDILHTFDRSRRPGDPGWYLSPLEGALYGKTRFRSGEVITYVGERVEADGSERVPWRHTLKLYALKHGGICYEIDPRFPGDVGDEKLWERMYLLPDGRIRFEEWYTPATARGGRISTHDDREGDVRAREPIDDQRDLHAPAAAFVACPRPSEETRPPRATIVDPSSWPRTIREGEGLRCVAAIEADSGPVDRLRWYANLSRHADKAASDLVHVFTDLPVGQHAIVLESIGPGGTGRSTRPRTVTVERSPVPEPPRTPDPKPPQGVVTSLQGAHETFLRVRDDGELDARGADAGPWEQIEVVEVQ
jgi:hypothetical protein